MAKLWGGRFSEKDIDSQVMDFTSSIDTDRVLAEYDCVSSKVHVKMLLKIGVLDDEEAVELLSVLDEVMDRIKDGSLPVDGFEDIHSAIQGYVESKAPSSSRKMHTARSRNEQIVNDMRLYCRDKADTLIGLITGLQGAFVSMAERFKGTIIPGYTHLNRAQPVLFSHLALSYTEMLERDKGRIEDARRRLDISVMGSGAIAGSALDLDRRFVSDELGFKTISANSIDSVSDRDFIAELISGLCFISVHLSRICEDLILYSIPEFGFLSMGDAYCTGSSLMPQKRNPDVLELIRGRTSSVISSLNTLFTLMKGLPHSYNRDLQEDKAPLFSSVKTVSDSLSIMARLIDSIEMKKDAASGKLDDEFIYATDIAEYLVRKGTAFKDAHDIVGSIVKHCVEKDINISDLSISELKGFSSDLDEDIYGLLNPETSIKNKKTAGSTNPAFVEKEITVWKKKLRS